MRILWAIGAAGVLLGGCTCGGARVGDKIDYGDDFFPETWKHPAAVWQVGTMRSEATIRVRKDGNTRILELLHADRVVETEAYEVSTEQIALVHWWDDSERFEPALPLLKFPMPLPSDWEWKGEHHIGSRALDAEAKVSATKETLDLATGTTETVKVTVTLKTRDGSGTEKERTLTFWFAPGEGPVRREYGLGQVREPRSESESVNGNES
ncbi:MAG: hypothetical protein AB1725_05800 [Armatimonadota bacterium]